METQSYHFTEKEYRSNLKVSYNRVINAKNGIGCTANGKIYALFDQYCKTPDCPCTEVSMEWIEHGNNNPHIITFNFDYNTRLISEASETIPKEMLDFVNEKKFAVILKERNLRMRLAFESFCLKRENSQLKNKLEKIGRNDLCVCGSGKKYKKCCGA